MEQRKTEAEVTAEREQERLEERLHDEALAHYLLTAEDPNEEHFEILWAKSGCADALAAHELRRQRLAKKRMRENYS